MPGIAIGRLLKRIPTAIPRKMEIRFG
jgi:hypothetical protein